MGIQVQEHRVTFGEVVGSLHRRLSASVDAAATLQAAAEQHDEQFDLLRRDRDYLLARLAESEDNTKRAAEMIAWRDGRLFALQAAVDTLEAELSGTTRALEKVAADAATWKRRAGLIGPLEGAPRA